MPKLNGIMCVMLTPSKGLASAMAGMGVDGDGVATMDAKALASFMGGRKESPNKYVKIKASDLENLRKNL